MMVWEEDEATISEVWGVRCGPTCCTTVGYSRLQSATAVSPHQRLMLEHEILTWGLH